MIRTVDVARTFETFDGPIRAVDEISVTLKDKGMVFIIGKSGSGKSTFLNLLAGYDKPTYGNIYVNDRDITKFSQQELSDYQFKDLGFVFQNYSLIENANVYLNISLGSKISYKKCRKEIDKVLKEVGLKDYGKRIVSKLSGGEKQRVALARAILKKPKIILCDEPCGNLDTFSSKVILDILKKQSRRALVVVVSHNLNDAYTYADRVLTLDKGELVEDKIFNKKLTRQKGIKYITDFNALTEEEIEEINVGLSQGEISYIFRRKDFFIDNDYDTSIIEENEEKEEPPKDHFVPQIIGILNKKFIKVSLFSLLIGLALALFSICYAIESFNGDSFYETAFDNYSYNTVSYNKGVYSSDEKSTLPTTYFDKINDNDRALITNNGYEGNTYELYNIGLYTTNYESTIVAHKNARRTFIQIENFDGFYPYETGGVLITNEDFIKKNLKIDAINYVERVDESQWQPSGILITDYVADAFAAKRPETYPTRRSVLGNHSDITFGYNVYVNAIIDTNYEQESESLRRSLLSNSSSYLSLINEENIELYEYMKNALNITYTTNANFLEDYKAYNRIVPKNGIRYQLKDDTSITMSTLGLTYSTTLPDNTIMVNVENLHGTFPNMSTQEIETAINEGDNEKIKVTLTEWSNDTRNASRYNWLSFNFDYIHVFDPNDASDEYYAAVTSKNHKCYVSENIFEQISDNSYYSYSFFMDDVDNAIGLKDVFKANSIYPNNEIYSTAMDLTNVIQSFDAIFILLTVASALIVVLIVSYYGINLVSSNKYNIGVFKALGYRGRELTLYYLVTLTIFFVLVMAFYMAFYSLFLSIVNDVLIDSLALYINQKITYFTTFGIFSFSPAMVTSVLAVFLVAIGLITLTYLLILRRFRAIRILQNKD